MLARIFPSSSSLFPDFPRFSSGFGCGDLCSPQSLKGRVSVKSPKLFQSYFELRSHVGFNFCRESKTYATTFNPRQNVFRCHVAVRKRSNIYLRKKEYHRIFKKIYITQEYLGKKNKTRYLGRKGRNRLAKKLTLRETLLGGTEKQWLL